MRHGSRMIDQRLYTAQAFGKSKEMGGAQEFFGCFGAIVFQRKAHHAAITPHLFAGYGIAGMVGEAAPIDLSDSWMLAQEGGDGFPFETKPVHPVIQGGD